jgi:hypothetical protein
MQTTSDPPQVAIREPIEPTPHSLSATDVAQVSTAELPQQPSSAKPPQAKAQRPRSKRATPNVPPLVRIVGVLAAVAAVAFAVIKLFDVAAERVREQDRFIVATRDIEATPLPVWVRTDLLAQVQRLAGLSDTLNTLEPDLAGELRDAFALHPWVREVVEVRITHPRTIRVKLEYREPVAVVQCVRSLEAVDRDGVVLPVAELPEPALYLTVTGVRSTPTGPVGTKWEDPALAGAVAVAAAIAPQHRKLGLTTIDVSGYRTNGNAQAAIYVLTDRGTRVKWGRPPNVDYPGEVPVQDKLDRLTQYAAEHGSLDEPTGPYDFDVTHWKEFIVRPRGQSSTKRR